MELFKKIQLAINSIDGSEITEQRKEVLQPLIDHIQEKINRRKEIRLNFICTHNSRRSHLSQIWAQTLASHFEIPNFSAYSGGTEATALFPMVAQVLSEIGFDIHQLSEGKNPVYSIKYAENELPVIGFSKKYDHPFNPLSDFTAVLTCDHADENCPFIPGAEKRIPITFEDPKIFDHTPMQKEKYTERSEQIMTELSYVFSKIQHYGNN
ncbi:protein-tyrosine-phosphatase [Namhaeicola litoreus]|uniref:Protein-tyrosine-phosphatase n=1 Tax=Namhaeicola litoreus TaxID=1052145 RepID=A0ABW3Y2B7_9FLAO